MRILSIPFFLVLLELSIRFQSNTLRILSAVVFIIISLSDLVDGFIARRRNQVTELGMILDPIADKLLMFSALIFLTNKGIPAGVTFALLVRELLIVGLRTIVGNDEIFPATKLGKGKTLFITIGIIMLLFNLPFYIFFMYVGLALSLISGWDYWLKAKSSTTLKKTLMGLINRKK